MSNGDDRLIGEIHAMVKEAKDQRAEMFTLIREIREKGCVVGVANGKRIFDQDQRLDSLERMTRRFVVVGVIVCCALFGIDKIVGWLG